MAFGWCVVVGMKSGVPRVLNVSRSKHRVGTDSCHNHGLILCDCPGTGADKYATRTYSLRTRGRRLTTTNCRVVNIDGSGRTLRGGFTRAGNLRFPLVTSARAALLRRLNY